MMQSDQTSGPHTKPTEGNEPSTSSAFDKSLDELNNLDLSHEIVKQGIISIGTGESHQTGITSARLGLLKTKYVQLGENINNLMKLCDETPIGIPTVRSVYFSCVLN